MENRFETNGPDLEFLSRQDARCLDDDDDWATDFDDDLDELDSFDLGVYAGALK